MKKKVRILSLLTALLMLISVIPFNVFAISELPTDGVISVEASYGKPGKEVTVGIDITNNPGILSMTLTLDYDESLAELTKIENGDALDALTFTTPKKLQSGISFPWDGQEIFAEDVKDGTFLKLTFKINEAAKPGDKVDLGLSYHAGAIRNNNLDPIHIDITNNVIKVIDFTPGDLNEDDFVDSTDVVLLRRFVAGGYGVTINEDAADVNDDGYIDTTDAVLIRRYIAGGYGVRLVPRTPKCQHIMEYIERKNATCTEDGNNEYWHCTECDGYFADEEGEVEIASDALVIKATGHHGIADDGSPATPTANGYSSGVWCDVCETWISGHDYIPPIAPNESNILYRHYVKEKKQNEDYEIKTDNYLSTHEIINPNPNIYTEGVGVTELVEGVEIDGKKVFAKGYSFLGWYEKPEVNARRVYSISDGETGDKILYGIWSKDEYTITYLPDSATSKLPRVENDTFTVDVEKSLKEPPEWANLDWVGWSDEKGNIIKSIPKGTAENVTLTANWMSKRNKTIPNTSYKTDIPAIYANSEDGIYAFIYDIGEIHSVPIQQVEKGVDGKGFNLVKGQTHEVKEKIIQKIVEGEATNVANVIANATTKSDSWTLSEDWNKSTSFSEEHSNEVSEEQSQKAAISLSQTDKYSISAGVGGTKEHIDETGKSTKTTKKDEFGVSVNVGAKTEKSAGINANLGASIGTDKTGKASAGVGAEIGQKDTLEGNLGMSYKHSKETTEEQHETHTDKNSSYWNVNEGFETSQSVSTSNEFSQSLRQSIKDTYSYGETLDYGGSNSNTVSSSNTSSQSRQYSSSVTYSTESGSEIEVNETLTGAADTGFYRKVITADFKVFAVVIYDVKTASYSTMSYSLKINDSERLFTDYSLESSFEDYENGVLPFEVPYKVSEYVYSLVGCSDGLRINDETGIIEGYGYKDTATGICYKKYDSVTGVYSEPCDTDVILPQYAVINGKIVAVKGFLANAFSGTNITSVYLNFGITEIPDNAFKDCISLKYITGGNIVSVGESAFENCTSLWEMNLGSNVESIGEDAYKGIEALTVVAANSEVAKAAINSGVKKLTLDLRKLSDSLDDTEIVTPDTMIYFAIIGNGKAYNDFTLESNAETVEISNITMNSFSEIPLRLSSKNIGLSFTSISSPGFVMRLSADSANIVLDGNNYLTTGSENVILCKDIILHEKEDSVSIGRMRINGNILVCGNTAGEQYAVFDSEDHKFVPITEGEYENYLKSIKITFDANGGRCDISSKDVYIGAPIGELPIPDRDYYTFAGWFMENGDEITAEKVFGTAVNIVLYAHWTENPLSDWVRADSDDIPEGAKIEETMWTYTKTETTESTESYLSGWGNPINSYWSETGSGTHYFAYFPSGYNAGDQYYNAYAKDRIYAYENTNSKRNVSDPVFNSYIYWHWTYPLASYNTTTFDRKISDIYNDYLSGGGYATLWCAFETTDNYPQTSGGVYKAQVSIYAASSFWWFRFNTYRQTYTDYQKIYQYKRVTDNIPSETEISNGGQISNVQKLVRYRVKQMI